MATYTITTGSHVTISDGVKTIDCAKNSMLYLVDESAIVNFYTRGAKAPTISVRLGDTTVNGTMMTRDNVDSLLSSIFASGGGGGGSTVAWTQTVTEGTKIAQISIDGVSTDVYAPEGGGGTTFYKKSDIDQMTSSERADLFDELAARYEAGDFDFAIILEQSDWYSGLALRLYPSSYEAGSNIVFRGIYDLYGTKSAFDYALSSDGSAGGSQNRFNVLSNDAWRFDIDASGNCSGPVYDFCRCCGEEGTGVNMYTFKQFGIGYKKPDSDEYTSYANILSRGYDDLAEVNFCVYTIEINGTLYIGRLSATYESSSITNDYFRPMFS